MSVLKVYASAMFLIAILNGCSRPTDMEKYEKYLSNHNTERIKELIRNGFDIEQISSELLSPLALAILNQDSAVIEILSNAGVSINNNGLPISEVHYATTPNRGGDRCDPVVLKQIIKLGGDPNDVDTIAGLTPLINAISSPGHECSKLLLTSGADVNFIDSQGRTALFHAAVSNNLEGAKLLIASGADPNIAAYDGTILPVQMASHHGETELVSLLNSARNQ